MEVDEIFTMLIPLPHSVRGFLFKATILQYGITWCSYNNSIHVVPESFGAWKAGSIPEVPGSRGHAFPKLPETFKTIGDRKMPAPNIKACYRHHGNAVVR